MTDRDRRPRRGTYTVLFIFSLPTVIGSGAVAVDLSAQKLARTQLQAVTDIAALAGTSRLDGTVEGMIAAEAAVARAARRNAVAGVPVEIVPDDLLLGDWDPAYGELRTNAVVEDIDSVQVRAARDDLEAAFSKLAFAWERLGVQGRSTGFNPPDEPASAIGCYLPLAIPACLFDVYDPEELDEVQLRLNPAGVDTVGWGRVGASPSSAWIRDQVWNCEQDGVIQVGDEVGLQNGVVQSGLVELLDALRDSSRLWDSEAWGPLPARMTGSSVPANEYGRVVEGAIVVFDGGEAYCRGSGGNYNGYEELVGFAWAAIYDIKTTGSSSSRNLRLKLDMHVDHAVGLRGGGGDFGGVTYQTPGMLVR